MKKPKLGHIHIESAKNGYSIRHRSQRPPAGTSEPMMPEEEQQPTLARNRAEIHKHIDNVLDQHAEPDGDEAMGGAESAEASMSAAPDDEAMKNHPLRGLFKRKR